MPAARMYVSVKDIAAYLGISRPPALAIMHVFQAAGKTIVADGKGTLKVDSRTFANWIADNNGKSRNEEHSMLKSWLRENAA